MLRFRVPVALALAVLVAACGGGKKSTGGTGGGPIPNTGQGWTFLVYVVADNDLEPFALMDLQEMMAVGSGNELRIVVQADRSPGYANDAVGGLANWTSAKRLEVTQGGLREVQDLGEVDMSAGATLADFVRWGLTTYPGQRTALVLWDHGGGWVGFGVDETTGQGALMNLPGITSGIQQGLAQAGKAKFDLIGFDACLMATFEVAESLKGMADLLLASEETEPGHGWDYRSLAGVGSATTPLQLGTRIADGFKAQANDPAWKTGAQITLSVVDLARLGPIEAAIAALSTTYPNGAALAGAPINSLGQARSGALAFGANPDPQRSTHLVDLRDLFDRAASVSGNAAIASAVQQAVLYQVNGSATAASSGLAIYFPPDPALYQAAYDALPGTAAWRAFLAAAYGGGSSAATLDYLANTPLVTENATEVLFTADVNTPAAVADAFLVYGIREQDQVGNYLAGAFLFGENQASLSGSTITGVWDWTFMRLAQGTYEEFGYLSLRSISATQAMATIPLIYEAPGSAPRDAFWVIVFDATSIISDTYYAYTQAGAVAELTPAANSRLRAVVAYLPDAGAWQSPTDPDTRQWIPYAPGAAGFNATQTIGIQFVDLPSQAQYFIGLRAQNAGGAGPWSFTPTNWVRP